MGAAAGARIRHSAGSTIVQLWDSAAACGGENVATFELGPAVLRSDETVSSASTGAPPAPRQRAHPVAPNPNGNGPRVECDLSTAAARCLEVGANLGHVIHRSEE